jgi:hypothetical protein
MRRLFDSDIGIYVTTGLFVSLVFLVAVAIVAVTPTLALTPRTPGRRHRSNLSVS